MVSRVPLRPVGILRDERRTNPWLDVAIGVVLAAPIALIMSQIEQLCLRDDACEVIGQLLRKLDVVTNLSAWTEPRQLH